MSSEKKVTDSFLTQYAKDIYNELLGRGSGGGGDSGDGMWEAGTGTGSKQSAIEYNNGVKCVASGDYSTADGAKTTASGDISHAEGWNNLASGNGSHAEGLTTEARGEACHSEGAGCKAVAPHSHAEGCETYAGGAGSHAEGTNTQSMGYYSHTDGYCTKALFKCQHVFGEWNKLDDAPYVQSTDRGTYVEIVGNGRSSESRANARTLSWSGTEWVAGNYEAVGSLTLGKGTSDQVTLSASQLKRLLALLN